MSKPVDWTALGLLVGWLVSLFTIIRETLTKLGIGMEIFPWLLAEGKEFFIKCLTLLGEEFRKTKHWVMIDENTILVNLDISPKLPFGEVDWHEGTGWVRLQKRSNGLFYAELKSDGQFGNDREIVILRSELQQKNGKAIQSSELLEELTDKSVLNANILDALLAYTRLIPKEWRTGEGIFFWATRFRSSKGELYVRSFRWSGARWESGHYCLETQWISGPSAASLE